MEIKLTLTTQRSRKIFWAIPVLTILMLVLSIFSQAQLSHHLRQDVSIGMRQPLAEECSFSWVNRISSIARSEDNSTASGSSFGYISLGQRSFQEVPSAVFILLDSTYTEVDLGKGKPVMATFGILAQPEENGFAFNFALEGFLGTASGIGFNIGGGYKLGNDRFSFTPLISAGLGRLWTHIDSYELDSLIIPGSFLSSGSKLWFVGPNADNFDRGGGANLGYKLGSVFFNFKLSVNTSYRISDKLFILADVGYNLVYGSSKNIFEINGKGYDSLDEFNTSDQPPHLISVKPDGDRLLVDNKGNSYAKTPYNLSGLMIQLGVGFPLR